MFPSTKPGRAAIFALVSLFAVMLVSCTSFRANRLLLKETTPDEKAELLFADGLERYNYDILKLNNLTKIKAVRTRFSDALKLDPEHPRAQRYISDLDAFRDKQYAAYLASAKSLASKSKRTAAQDFELVLAVKKLNDLTTFDKEVSQLSKDTKELRAQVIATKTAQVVTYREKMIAEKSASTQLKYIKDTEYLARDLQRIDPSNADARKALRDASDLREGLPVSATVTAAPKATSTTKTAAHDYDAELASILTAVDARINKDDPAGAQNVIRSYMPLLKKQTSKTKLTAKEDAVKALASELYADGITLYNEEDYEGAQTYFSAVVQYNAKYEDAQDYLERTNTKIRALSGR